ncbi:MAG: hypothetical protein AAB721_02800 [Patescibacteria group bacterium]
MRAISAAEEALLFARGGVVRRFRVQVKDSGGTYRDLSTWAGPNFVVSGQWGESVDGNGMDATIELKLAVDQRLTLAPLMTKSPLNLGFAFPGSYAPLVELGRDIKIERALAPGGTPYASLSWVKAWAGVIDIINPSRGKLTIQARGEYARILDKFIEDERVYAHSVDADAVKGFLMWQPGRPTVLNDLTIPEQAKRNAHFYQATSIGSAPNATGSTQPTWPTGAASTVADGDITWTEKGATTTTSGTAVETVMQRILNDNALSAVTLNTPASPAWNITTYAQERTGVWSALRALANQIGYDLRYVWHAGSSDFRLELRAVDRAKTVPDRTFSPDDRFRISKLETKLDGIRNAIRIIYTDSGDRDAQGNPKRKFLTRTNSSSITKYARRFMEVQEAWNSNIDSAAEAQTFGDAILADLATPVAEQECAMPFFPFVELGDLYRFSADGVHYDSDQDLAVVSYQHSFSGDQARTSITCRGKPSGGYRRWLEMDAGRNSEAHQIDNNTILSLAVTSKGKVGGAKMNVAETFDKMGLTIIGHEFHKNPTAGFTPTSATLVQRGDLDHYAYGDGYSGDTEYGQVIPFSFNRGRIIRGQPSAEFSMVNGFVEPHHLNPEKFRMELPPNGSFEGQHRSAKPPDRWEMSVGTWETDVKAGITGGIAAADGARYLFFLNTSVATSVRTDYFPVNRAHVYQVLAQVYKVSGDNNYALDVEWFDYAKSSISTSTLTIDLTDLTSSVWNLVRTVFKAPSTAAFARFAVRRASAHTDVAYFDGCRLDDLGEPWIYVGDSGAPTFSNSWVNYDATNEAKAGFRFDNGHCELKGIIKDGSAINTAAFTLPVPWRPQKTVRIAVPSNGAFGQVDIGTGGNVTPVVGSTTAFVLDGVRFAVFD